MIRAVLLTTSTLLLFGCAGTTTGITAFSNPDFESLHIKKIYVDVRGYPIETQVDAEKTLKDRLQRYDVTTIGRIEALPPFRDYTAAEVEAKLREISPDALLLLAVEDADSETYSGGSMTFGTANAYSYGSYANAYASSFTVPTVVTISNAQITATLVEPMSGEVIWKGYVKQTGRNESWATSFAAGNVIWKVIRKLGDDKIFRR